MSKVIPNARLLAIDVGTQSVRAIVFDQQGRLLAKAQVPLEPPYISPQPGWAEQDPEIYWNAIVAACQQLWAQGEVRPESISGLSLTTLRSTVVCADATGRPLRPAIVWLDQRKASQLPPLGPLWNTAFRLAGASGLMHHLQTEAEANWLAQNEPELWGATDKFVFISGWLVHRMVGEWVDSSGAQVGFVPFDYKRLAWAAPADFKWRAVAVRQSQLPRLVAPGGKLGTLKRRSGRPGPAGRPAGACGGGGQGLRGARQRRAGSGRGPAVLRHHRHHQHHTSALCRSAAHVASVSGGDAECLEYRDPDFPWILDGELVQA